MVVGTHSIKDTKGHPFNFYSPRNRLPQLKITYPTPGNPKAPPTVIPIYALWNKLEDKNFKGNIVETLSTSSTGLTTCPLMPQILPQTVSNLILVFLIDLFFL